MGNHSGLLGKAAPTGAAFFVAHGNAVVHHARMLKVVLVVLVALLAVFGLWYALVSGPQKLDQIDRIWPGGGDAHPVIVRNVGYGSIDPRVDDARQAYDVYYPDGVGRNNDDPDCGGRKYPSLIFFHGGSWRDGDKASYAFVGREFARRGFFTFVVDYRKAPRNIFPDFVADAARAMASIHRSLPEYGCADPARLYVMGHSAGAHIAMLAALDPRWLAANDADPSIIAGVIGLAGPYDFYPFTSDAAKAALGYWPHPAETQPITYARGDAPPLLLLTGDVDTTVKPRNSRVLAERVTALGGKVQLKLYPGVGHSGIIMAVSRPFRSIAPVVDDVVAFTRAEKP